MFRLYGDFLATSPPSLPSTSSSVTQPPPTPTPVLCTELQPRLPTIFATALHERGHLRNDVTIDDARDTLWTYNSAELYQLLVIERSWTADHYGQWVAAALTAALL